MGKTAPVVLTRDDRMFRTRLKEASKEKPNFAGRYILTAWGCGTTCLMGAVIDAKTGKVYWWGFSICCWSSEVDGNFRPIEFRLNSKLIVFSGARNEKNDDSGAHFYKFENGRFVHLRSALSRRKGSRDRDTQGLAGSSRKRIKPPVSETRRTIPQPKVMAVF